MMDFPAKFDYWRVMSMRTGTKMEWWPSHCGQRSGMTSIADFDDTFHWGVTIWVANYHSLGGTPNFNQLGCSNLGLTLHSGKPQQQGMFDWCGSPIIYHYLSLLFGDKWKKTGMYRMILFILCHPFPDPFFCHRHPKILGSILPPWLPDFRNIPKKAGVLPNNLVGGWPTPLKNMSSSMGRIIPYIMENKIHVW